MSAGKLGAFGVLAAACAGCPASSQGDGGNGDAGPPTLTIAPASLSLNASAQPVLFSALTHLPGAVSWSLAPAVGTLSSATGSSTLYTPPASVPAQTAVTLTATLATAGLTAQAALAIGPGGVLTVQVTSPPLVAPPIGVSSAAGYQRTLLGTATLAGLAPGAYSVTATVDRVPGPIADVIYDSSVSGSPATVTNGGAALVSVLCAQRHGTRSVWIPSPAAGLITGYDVEVALEDAGTAVTLLPGGAPRGLAIDGQGALWAADPTAGTVSRYPPNALLTGGTPDLVWRGSGDGGALSGPVALAFDPSGNLWVANAQDLIVEFPTSSLDSGIPKPSVLLIDRPGVGSNEPSDLAFDSSGNLWVSHAASGTVVEFSSVAQLSGQVSPAPAMTLGPFAMPEGLAFDSAGSLWVALGDGGSVLELAPGGALTATLEGLRGDGGAWFRTPAGLAFDNLGSLWVSTGDQLLLQYTSAESWVGLSTPSPAVSVFAGDWTQGGKPAFDPPPSVLPLRQ